MTMLAAVVIKFEGEPGFLDSSSARAGTIVLVAFLVSFLFIRTSARLMRSPKVPWWPGSVKTSDLHVHHLVFGIVLLLSMGFALALRPGSPLLEIVAAGFGIGAGLTLDEYALWLHLEDVYWAEEGRRSVDAVIIAALLGGLLLEGFLPFSTDAGAVSIVITVVIVLAVSVVALLKGKIVLGVTGVLLPFVGLVGAIRLAKPHSAWARRRYAPGSRKLARATARYERHSRRYRRFQDHLAGAPARPPAD